MHLDVTQRDALVDGLVRGLRAQSPGSSVELIGSLGSRTGDEYSDIDLRWTIRSDDAMRCICSVKEILDSIEAVESLRNDPEFIHSDTKRLIFVRFRDMPLFWRLDLEIRSAGLRSDGSINGRWSMEESAAMNVIATIKAIRRDQLARAEEIFENAVLRVETADIDENWNRRIGEILSTIETRAPSLSELVEKIRQLNSHLIS